MSRRGRAGFTLLELTVALAVSALALASLTHLVHDAAGLDVRLGERLRAHDETEALVGILELLLSDPQRELNGEASRLAEGSGGPSVYGGAHAITIISRGPRVLGLADPTAFTLSFDAGSAPDRGRVSFGWSPATGKSEPEIVAHARDFALRYAAATGRSDLAWTDSWSRPVAALALVKVSYVEAASGRPVSRLVPVVPSLPRICVLRPLLEGCPEWR